MRESTAREKRSSPGVHALGKSRVALRECAVANGTSGNIGSPDGGRVKGVKVGGWGSVVAR